jgi:hypothetical protein
MDTSTGVIPLPCHSICDFVLLITASNVVWWKKNVKSMFQEVTNGELAGFSF